MYIWESKIRCTDRVIRGGKRRKKERTEFRV